MQDWTPLMIAAATNDKIANDSKIAEQQREELKRQHQEQLELLKRQEIKEEFNNLMSAINFNTTSVNPNFEIEEDYWKQLQLYIKDKNKLEIMTKYFTKNFQKKLELDSREKELDNREEELDKRENNIKQEKDNFEQALIKEKGKINIQLRQEFCANQITINEMLKKEEQELTTENNNLKKENDYLKKEREKNSKRYFTIKKTTSILT